MEAVVIALRRSGTGNIALTINGITINPSRVGSKDVEVGGVSEWRIPELRLPPEINKVIWHHCVVLDAINFRLTKAGPIESAMESEPELQSVFQPDRQVQSWAERRTS